MGAAASTEAPYASEKEALDDGKTQAEIDAWKKAHPAATAAASADDASSDIEILYWGIPWRGNYMRLLLVRCLSRCNVVYSWHICLGIVMCAE